ncbi:MAG: HD-GYP domain-containing protein [Elusimicrobia bacterium]|nr:HD-GYP domain-containing protein [Elusimicrobiota bacterium]
MDAWKRQAATNKTISPFTWEDGVLLVLTLAWVIFGGREDLFHVYTVGIMVMLLSLGLRKGMVPPLIRAAGLTGVLYFSDMSHGRAHPGFLTQVLPMMGCGFLAGILGGRQKRAQEALKLSFTRTLQALAQTLEARDPYTEGHSRRTARYAVAIAGALGLDRKSMETIGQAGLLHDFGKIGTPDAVLLKNGALTPEEERRIQEHPVVGGRILEGIPSLEPTSALVHCHHERYDGSGYPAGLAGTSIPLKARILTMADTLDALMTDRPYRKTLSWDDAILELERGSGRLFDPAVLGTLRRLNLKDAEAIAINSLDPKVGAV